MEKIRYSTTIARRSFSTICLLLLLYSCGVNPKKEQHPDIASYPLTSPKITAINDSVFSYNQNFLAKNKHHLWELYNTGNALQLGYNQGALSQKLIENQEHVFFDKMKEFVPSKFKQKILRAAINVYTRKMGQHIREDFQAELFGISRYSSDDFDFIQPKFRRSLLLHAAHDIGHAVASFMQVGCSSLAVWDENSEDRTLLIGRVFDFYVGDDFAENKMVSFVKPESGIPYASVSWPAMIGVASGMNKNGITVTINAGKSKIPWSAKTPISLVAREILQYASTINEAIAIAKKREVFVSESILVGSGHERKAVIIEVSPTNFGVFEAKNSSQLICTNHFQSKSYEHDQRNVEQKENRHSNYRYQRLEELIDEKKALNPEKMATILRNRFGLKDALIGNGNEKAINQLLAHHAVIFSPEKNLMWVSAPPYQLGDFVAYDLNKIFSGDPKIGDLEAEVLTIPKDPFADSEEYKRFENFRKMTKNLKKAIKNKTPISPDFTENYIASNPEFWKAYDLAGQYYWATEDYDLAKKYFKLCLEKEISSVEERKNVELRLKKAVRKQQ